MTRLFRAHKPKAAPMAKRASASAKPAKPAAAAETAKRPKEIGGPSGLDPTRYGDWERKGICVDF